MNCPICKLPYGNPERIVKDDEGRWVHIQCYQSHIDTIPRAALEAVVKELGQYREEFRNGIQKEADRNLPTGMAFYQGSAAQLDYVIWRLRALLDPTAKDDEP